MKKLKTYIAINIISLVLLALVLNSSLSVWYIINKFFSCETSPYSSFPCYGIYDIYFMWFLAVTIFVTLIMMILNLINNKLSWKNL